MRCSSRAILAGVLGFAVSCLAACGGGGSGLLSTGQSSALNGQLDHVSSAVATHNCGAAASAATGFANAVGELPASVNRTLRSNLRYGASKVSQLAAQDCKQPASTLPSTTLSTTTSAGNAVSTPSSPPTTTSSSTSIPLTTTSASSTASPATTSAGSGTTPTSSNSGGAGVGGTGPRNGGGGAGNGGGPAASRGTAPGNGGGNQQ